MKYIKELNIDFDNWDDTINEVNIRSILMDYSVDYDVLTSFYKPIIIDSFVQLLIDGDFISNFFKHIQKFYKSKTQYLLITRPSYWLELELPYNYKMNNNEKQKWIQLHKKWVIEYNNIIKKLTKQ